ncbi:Zinc carboxypeptidase [Porphyridium purpureum]|uniref:Zinc carboxypeptidase n=1 Tax=Porphyridium purpureum TaxID=35688 RepID=A0A5J4Z4M3_PORPP|nr:Zinc carboxypeptidase [Porphyridium purpureum]|eukprot:POR9463..scf295_1
MQQGRVPRAGLAVGVLLMTFIYAAAATPKYRFKYMSYAEMVAELHRLASEYPDVMRLEDAVETYSLPEGGLCRSGRDAARPDKPCQVLVARIGLKPVERSRPQMLVLGSMHGDEQLGAMIAFYLVKVMLERYREDPWLGRLISSREIVVVPMPNPYGFDRMMRYEEVDGQLIDPNADFPYGPDSDPNPVGPGGRNGTEGSGCLRALTSRVVHELFMSHIFRVALVFHGKKEFIGYSWSSESFCVPRVRNQTADLASQSRSAVTQADAQSSEDDSDDEDQMTCVDGYRAPDANALSQVATFMSLFAGSFKGSTFRSGALNDPRIYHPSRGGMVDWAYSASFMPDQVLTCEPDQLHGYSRETTQVGNATNRCLTFVIETGHQVRPKEKDLGSSAGLYAARSKQGNGHVTRNIRLALMAADLMEPYVFFIANEEASSHRRSGGSNVDVVSALTRGGILSVKWSVGGALYVDQTYLVIDVVRSNFSFTTKVQSGGSMWAQNHGVDGYGERFAKTEGVFFSSRSANLRWAYSESISLYKYLPAVYRETGAMIRVRAVATVDQSWLEQPAPNSGDARGRRLASQSHMARSRTDPDWFATNAGYDVRGKVLYMSEPIRVRLPAFSLMVSWQAYIWELLIVGVLIFFGPPLAWLYKSFYTNAPSAMTVRSRLRRVFELTKPHRIRV